MHEGKARELYKNAVQSLEQIKAATLHKMASVRPLTFHL